MKEIKDEKGLTLEDFLKIYKTKNYPKPYLTADCIIASKKENQLYILLIKRKNHPSINCYGIAGGFASSCETLLECARRELKEETTLEVDDISLLNVYSKPGRDPRGWVVTQAYLCKVNFTECKALAGDDAKNAEWFDLTVKNQIITLDNGDCIISFKYENGKIEYISKDKLAFDHAEIIAKAIELL